MTISQLPKFVERNNFTFDRFLLRNNDLSQSAVITSLPSSSQLQRTTTKSFLAEERHVSTSSTSESASTPSASIDPSRYLLVKTVCFLLVYVNHAINFYLYCLTGKRFRQELAAILNCGRVTLLCSGRTNADQAVAAAAGVACEMAMRRDVHLHQ